MTDHLLPPNATAMERQLSQAGGIRIDALPHRHRTLWDPWSCPAQLLPYLAWTLSVDDWSPDWPEQARRAAVAESIELHRRKGTPWAVKRSLQRLGYQGVEILEATNRRLDGSWELDGTYTLGDDIGPYEFDIVLNTATAFSPGSDAVIDGGTPYGSLGDVIDGGSPSGSTGEVIDGGTPGSDLVALGEPTPELLAEIRRLVGVWKNERSHLRNIYTYQLYLDGTWSLGGAEQIDGGIA